MRNYVFITLKGVPILVYVISNNGQPLMPTNRHGKVKHLLRSNQAKVVKRCPFTIQLLYDTTSYTQDIVLGVDAGSKVIGLSASTESEEVYSGEVELRNDIVELLSTKRELRTSRRKRKTRYRAPRFNNRVHSKSKGWLAPSVENKIQTHLKVISGLHKILPISKIIVEIASFDIQKIKNPDIKGIEYQWGEMLDHWNVREYVLFRDGHKCQCCKGKSKDPVLEVHHIESRKTGGDAPNNLVTLCKTCHDGHHDGTIVLPKTIKRGMKFNDVAFMGIMRWAFYNKLKGIYPNVSLTYGYITKNTRITNGLEKTHYNDAKCITGFPKSKPLDCYYHQRKVRNHNRQLHKRKINKGSTRKSNIAPKEVFGFQLFDKVRYNNAECFVFGRRTSGYFDIRTLDGTKVSPCAKHNALQLLEKRKTILTERRSKDTIVV